MSIDLYQNVQICNAGQSGDYFDYTALFTIKNLVVLIYFTDFRKLTLNNEKNF